MRELCVRCAICVCIHKFGWTVLSCGWPLLGSPRLFGDLVCVVPTNSNTLWGDKEERSDMMTSMLRQQNTTLTAVQKALCIPAAYQISPTPQSNTAALRAACNKA
jgi:hypothetical protein